MPLYDGTPLDIEQWSGYVDIPFRNPKTGKDYYHHLFYVLVKKPNPSAPLMIWLDGGPGCSSLNGYIREHGPFSYDGVKAEKRDFSWSEFASILYIDSPIGTGFSFSDDRSDYGNFLNDKNTADDLLQFLIGFFDQFPDLLDNDLFISGESYAGHFVPQFTRLIDHYNDNMKKPTFNLKGYLIGNGVTDYKYMVNSLPKFLTNHFVVPKNLYDEAYSLCKGDFWGHFFEKNCSYALGVLTQILYQGVLNPLDIYSPCEKNGIAPLICTDSSVMEEYINLEIFQETFGVDVKNTISGKKYEMCVNLEPLFKYSSADAAVSQIPIHQNLTKKGYSFLFYSGDADTIVNNLASEMIMDVLMPEKEKIIEGPWYYYTSSSSTIGKNIQIKQFGGRTKTYNGNSIQ